jgi:hypothetical protein
MTALPGRLAVLDIAPMDFFSLILPQPDPAREPGDAMHIPAAFRQNDLDLMHELMRSHPLGMLISQGASGLVASQIPFLIYEDKGEHGYVSPSWYVGKAEHHKVVPTWNYITVHVWGNPPLADEVGGCCAVKICIVCSWFQA